MKKLLVLQLDGLSYPSITNAIADGSMPFLASLVANNWHLKELYCGIPSTTPASQFRLFYGDCQAIPGFRFLQKSVPLLFSPLKPETILAIEKERSVLSETPLFTGGATIMSIFDGQAKESVSLYTMRKDWKTIARLLMHTLNPWQFTRLLIKISLLYFVERSEHKVFTGPRRSVHSTAEHMFHRVIQELVEGEMMVSFTRHAMSQASPAIYTDMIAYDHLSHVFGPKSQIAKYYLSVMDRYCKQFFDFNAKLASPYEIVLLSDHGQTESKPFAEIYGASLRDKVGQLLVGLTCADESADIAFDPSRTKDVYILASGGLALIYFMRAPEALSQEQIETISPGSLANIAAIPGVGMLVSRQGGQLMGHVRDQVMPLSQAWSLAPWAELSAVTKEMSVLHLTEIMTGPYAPDMVLLAGQSDRTWVTFEDQTGSHGSVGGAQTQSFVLTQKELPADVADLADLNGYLYRQRFNPS